MSEGSDLSYIKFETSVKGIVQPTISVKVGTTNEEMDIIRKIAVEQLIKTVIDVKNNKFNCAIEGEFSL